MDYQNNSGNTEFPRSAIALDEINKQTIRDIKLALKQVSVQKVRERLGFTKANLGYHLNPKNASKAKVHVLEKIMAAIEKEKAILLERSMKVQHRAKAIAA